MNLGLRLKELREKKKWSQNDLASKLFVSNKTISSWESNRTEPNLELIVKLSEVLECSASYLIYGDIPKNTIETEIKIKISASLYATLDTFFQKNARFLTESTQKDTYFEPTHRPFLKEKGQMINEWLRIGERGNKKILNYKNWHNNMYCDEYEVEIDNSQNLTQIFTILNLKKIAEVQKSRKSYLYQDKYEVSLDKVERLGHFIEIEVKKYDTTAYSEYDKLLKLAHDLNLNLNNIDKVGYPYHFIYQ